MNKYTILQNPLNLIQLSFRTYVKATLKPIHYHGFTYYPRHENFKDPPYEPSKLFWIKRLKPLKGLSKYERNILERLNIDGPKQQSCHISIVKNIPEINALLWEVKHIVEIKPIRWTGKLPEDCMGTHLRDTGELVISPKLKVQKEALEESEKFDKKKFGPGYLKAYLLEEWKKGYS